VLAHVLEHGICLRIRILWHKNHHDHIYVSEWYLDEHRHERVRVCQRSERLSELYPATATASAQTCDMRRLARSVSPGIMYLSRVGLSTRLLAYLFGRYDRDGGLVHERRTMRRVGQTVGTQQFTVELT
jgi:hypothetical protein